MKILLAILILSSCAKPLTNGPRVITNVNGNYVKFDGLNRWYYIPDQVKKGDTLLMRLKSN